MPEIGPLALVRRNETVCFSDPGSTGRSALGGTLNCSVRTSARPGENAPEFRPEHTLGQVERSEEVRETFARSDRQSLPKKTERKVQARALSARFPAFEEELVWH